MENVQLIYENCEVLTIPTSFIKFINLTDISKDFTFNANQEYVTNTVKEGTINFYIPIFSILAIFFTVLRQHKMV